MYNKVLQIKKFYVFLMKYSSFYDVLSEMKSK